MGTGAAVGYKYPPGPPPPVYGARVSPGLVGFADGIGAPVRGILTIGARDARTVGAPVGCVVLPRRDVLPPPALLLAVYVYATEEL